jgi:hypothetical protein
LFLPPVRFTLTLFDPKNQSFCLLRECLFFILMKANFWREGNVMKESRFGEQRELMELPARGMEWFLQGLEMYAGTTGLRFSTSSRGPHD